MTKTTKNTIKSVIVLTIITVVAVVALALANAFFPKYQPSLDFETVSLINRICPSGVDDQTAADEKYYKIKDTSELNVDLDEFNKKYGSNDDKVWAVYEAVKGDNVGRYIVESQSKGRDGLIVMLTAYDADFKIKGVINKSNVESYWFKLTEYPQDVFAAFIGKSGILADSGDVLNGKTGATISFDAVTRAVTLANTLVSSFPGAEAPKPVEVTDAALIANLKKVSTSNSFISYPVPKDKINELYGIYKGDNGDVLVASKGKGYKSMTMLVTALDNAVDKIVWLNVAEDIEGAYDRSENEDTLNFASVFTEEWCNTKFSGKTLTELNAADNVLNGTSGATLVRTARGIKECLINALSYIPQASEYISTFDGGNNG